jgi:hypothetical protein
MWTKPTKRVLLEKQATKVSLVLVNPLGREFPAHIRLEVLDPEARLCASSESDGTIERGTSILTLNALRSDGANRCFAAFRLLQPGSESGGRADEVRCQMSDNYRMAWPNRGC